MKTTLLSVFFFLAAFLSQGQWSYDNLSEPRGRMGTAVLGTKVYFAGGQNVNGCLSSIQVYDVENEDWDETDFNLSVARMHPSGVACGTKVIFAGGVNMLSGEVYSDVDIFDTATNQWTSAQLFIPRVFLSSVSKGNVVLFAGGTNLITDTEIVEVYNIQTETWTISILSQPRSGMGAAVVGDLAFFAGGFNVQTASVTEVVDIYNFSTNTWSTDTLSEARGFLTAATVGNKVLFAGGTKANNSPSDRVDIYDALTGEWSIASLSIPRALFPESNSATVCDKVYFTSGGHFDINQHNWMTDFNVIDIYNSSDDTWTVDYLTESLLVQAVAGVDDHLIVAGGWSCNTSQFVSNVEIYIDPNPWTGIYKPDMDAFFSVYPNPSKDKITISSPAITVNAELTIFNVSGQKVIERQLTDNETQIDISALPRGVYFVRVQDEKMVEVGKIIKE